MSWICLEVIMLWWNACKWSPQATQFPQIVLRPFARSYHLWLARLGAPQPEGLRNWGKRDHTFIGHMISRLFYTAELRFITNLPTDNNLFYDLEMLMRSSVRSAQRLLRTALALKLPNLFIQFSNVLVVGTGCVVETNKLALNYTPLLNVLAINPLQQELDIYGL